MQRSRHWLGILMLAAASVGAPRESDATTTLGQSTIEELTGFSSIVVHGTVQSIASYGQGQKIYTNIEVRVTEALKGSVGSDVALLKLYGGSYGGKVTRVIGAPCFSTGEEVVVFLKQNGPGTYDVVKLAEGKFRVTPDDDGSAAVDRNLDAMGYIDPTAPPNTPESLESLKALVRAATR